MHCPPNKEFGSFYSDRLPKVRISHRVSQSNARVSEVPAPSGCDKRDNYDTFPKLGCSCFPHQYGARDGEPGPRALILC